MSNGGMLFDGERPQAEPERMEPEIKFYHYPDNTRKWTASIRLSDAEMHFGDGTTMCEALMLANIHWAMHGITK